MGIPFISFQLTPRPPQGDDFFRDTDKDLPGGKRRVMQKIATGNTDFCAVDISHTLECVRVYHRPVSQDADEH